MFNTLTFKVEKDRNPSLSCIPNKMSVIYGQTQISTDSSSFVTVTTEINMVKY